MFSSVAYTILIFGFLHMDQLVTLWGLCVLFLKQFRGGYQPYRCHNYTIRMQYAFCMVGIIFRCMFVGRIFVILILWPVQFHMSTVQIFTTVCIAFLLLVLGCTLSTQCRWLRHICFQNQCFLLPKQILPVY